MPSDPWKLLVIAVALGLLWPLEAVAPMFLGSPRRLRHDLNNLALGLFNALLASMLFAGVMVAVMTLAAGHRFGLLHRVSLPPWALWPAALIGMDIWMYAWHVLNHKVGWLWRFHAVHHSDTGLDASTALRFHTGEIVFSAAARLAVLPLLGIQAHQLLVYELILQPVILFHHSNVRLPGRADRLLRCVLVTPRMHWVHHSRLKVETDSNYASVLSLWDRLFGTFRRQDPSKIHPGLPGGDDPRLQGLGGMLLAPFRGRRGDP